MGQKNCLILGKRKTGFILGQKNLFDVGLKKPAWQWPKNLFDIGPKIPVWYWAKKYLFDIENRDEVPCSVQHHSSMREGWAVLNLNWFLCFWICVFLYLYVCICAIIFMYLYLCFAVEHHSSVKKCAYAGLFSICFYKQLKFFIHSKKYLCHIIVKHYSSGNTWLSSIFYVQIYYVNLLEFTLASQNMLCWR